MWLCNYDCELRAHAPATAALRDAGAGGGGVGSGDNLPPQLGSCGGAAPPPNFGLSMSFIFFVLSRELGSPKNSGSNPLSFSF